MLRSVLRSSLLFVAVAAAAADAADFAKDVRPVLESYCFGCHADGKKKGGVTFDAVKSSGGATDHKFWEAVLTNMRSSAMPPRRRNSRRSKSGRRSRNGLSRLSLLWTRTGQIRVV
jgi:hypothetical protein